jgi:hypothetical protein
VIIGSAFDVTSFDITSEREPIFAWLCAERSAGVCRLDGGRIGDLVQEALAAVGSWYGVSGKASSLAHLRSLHEAILGELHPDCDFGQFHVFRVRAFSSVGHALAAVIADGDQLVAAQESRQSAEAEVSIVKGAYYGKLGSYNGVYEHRAFARQIKWQSDDLESLSSGSSPGVEQLLARAIERGALLADEIREDRLI